MIATKGQGVPVPSEAGAFVHGKVLEIPGFVIEPHGDHCHVYPTSRVDSAKLRAFIDKQQGPMPSSFAWSGNSVTVATESIGALIAGLAEYRQ